MGIFSACFLLPGGACFVSSGLSLLTRGCLFRGNPTGSPVPFPGSSSGRSAESANGGPGGGAACGSLGEGDGTMEIGMKRFEWWTEGPGDRLSRMVHVRRRGGRGTIFMYREGHAFSWETRGWYATRLLGVTRDGRPQLWGAANPITWHEDKRPGQRVGDRSMYPYDTYGSVARLPFGGRSRR